MMQWITFSPLIPKMNRRIWIFVAVILGAVLLIMPKRARVTDYAMNTTVSIDVTAHKPKELADRAVAEIKHLDSLMSATDPMSDVYKLNHADAGTYVRVSQEVYEIIEKSIEISKKTDGAFDITAAPLCDLWNVGSENPQIPPKDKIEEALALTDYKQILLNPKDRSVALGKEGMSITLGAIAKGFAADRVCEILREGGAREAIIDLGGNIYILGREKTVGIQTPFAQRGEYFRKVTVCDKAVVTSGPYERYFEKDGKIYHHIMNPFTGYPADIGRGSATVISQNCTLADALSTAVFIKGEDALTEFEDCEAILYR